MLEERAILNEIAEIFSNPDTMQSDIMETYGLMREHLYKKYTDKMLKLIDAYQANAKNNPAPEVKLLKAWTPFVPEESRGRVNELVEMLNTFNAFKDMKNGMGEVFASSFKGGAEPYKEAEPSKGGDTVSAASTNSSVHHDGVYDIDESCYLNQYGIGLGGDNRAGLLMLFALMNR